MLDALTQKFNQLIQKIPLLNLTEYSKEELTELKKIILHKRKNFQNVSFLHLKRPNVEREFFSTAEEELNKQLYYDLYKAPYSELSSRQYEQIGILHKKFRNGELNIFDEKKSSLLANKTNDSEQLECGQTYCIHFETLK